MPGYAYSNLGFMLLGELLEIAPEIDLSLWPNFRHLAGGPG